MKKIYELPDCPVETALVLMGDRLFAIFLKKEE